MKFFLAAGILAQTLPTLSEKVPSLDVRSTSNGKLHASNLVANAQQAIHQKVGGRRLHPRRRLAVHAERVLRNAQSDMGNHVPCDPNSVDPDTGVLSCGQGHFCRSHPASKLGGVCSHSSYFDNKHQALETHDSASFMTHKSMNDLTRFQGIGYSKEECDPASPDTGILGCGHGKFCHQDEASALGGFCMLLEDNPSSRRLFDLEFAVKNYCNVQRYERCDCTGLDMISGSGVIYCLYDNLPVGHGCDDVIYSHTFRIYLSDSKFTKLYDCYEIKVPSHEKICVARVGENLDESCSISLNGQECSSCSPSDFFVDFDCTNVEGGTAGGTLPETSTIIRDCILDPNNNSTMFPHVSKNSPGTPGSDTGSAASLHHAIGQIGVVGSLMILLLKGT